MGLALNYTNVGLCYLDRVSVQTYRKNGSDGADVPSLANTTSMHVLVEGCIVKYLYLVRLNIINESIRFISGSCSPAQVCVCSISLVVMLPCEQEQLRVYGRVVVNCE